MDRESIFIGQQFHDCINSTQYNVFCLFSERNHTILIVMTYSIFLNRNQRIYESTHTSFTSNALKLFHNRCIRRYIS